MDRPREDSVNQELDREFWRAIRSQTRKYYHWFVKESSGSAPTKETPNLEPEIEEPPVG